MTVTKDKVFRTRPPAMGISGSAIKPTGWYTDYKDPPRFMNIKHLRTLFTEISHHSSVSDIVIKSNEPVTLKTKGHGVKAITHRCIYDDEVHVFARELSNDVGTMQRVSQGETVSGQGNVLSNEGIAEDKSIKNRYRYEIVGCSAKSTERGVSIIMRPLPEAPMKYSDLKIPLEFVENCIVKDGIVIVAGATGEGKSTTLGSVIRYVLENDTDIKGVILTHEDPIEVSFEAIRSEHSVVMQSAIGQGEHVLSFVRANRSAMRRSPDLVLLGELRDEDTIEAAVELSLTGHPVFATTHASNISSIFPRLISRFPQELQSQKAFDLIDTTRFLVAQKLIWTTEGKLMAVRETLVFTDGLRDYLKKCSNNTELLYGTINKIMREELLGAQSYLGQGNRLLEAGIIDEKNYRLLTGYSSVQEQVEDDINYEEMLAI